MEDFKLFRHSTTLRTTLLDDGALAGGEETLIADSRSGLTPAQMVERKLVGVLKSAPLFVSHLQRASHVRPG